jgi:hypothetical protein
MFLDSLIIGFESQVSNEGGKRRNGRDGEFFSWWS